MLHIFINIVHFLIFVDKSWFKVTNRVAKIWFLRGSAKTELKISCEDFYMLLLLKRHSSVHPTYSQHIFLFAF